jgi:spermidine/putrescine transport system permease protein
MSERTEPARRRASSKGRGLLAYSVLYLVFLYLPVLFLPLFSFNDGIIVAFPLKGFTTKWYADLAANAQLHRAIWNSLVVATTTAVVATMLGIFGARAVTQYRFPGRQAILGLIMSPLVLPEILLAVSLLIIMLQIFQISLSLFTVIIGHVLICIPYSMSVLISSFEGFDKSLEEAALDLGETPLSTFFRVTLPIVMPGVISSLLVTFTISLDEFIIAFFLSSTEPTLPVYIWGLLRFPARLPSVLALGTILLVVSVLLVGAAELIKRRAAARSGLQGGGFI